MKNSKHKVVNGEYTQLGSEMDQEETKKQLDEMSKDLARIKDKEKALDAENKILRAQLFAKAKKKSASSIAAEPRNRAMDYHSLPGEQKKSSPTKQAKVNTEYSSLAGEGTSSGSFDEEPVKLTPVGQQKAPEKGQVAFAEDIVIPDYQQTTGCAGNGESSELKTMDDEIEDLLSDTNQ